MADFKWEYKENMSKEDIDKVLSEHRNVVFAQGKAEKNKEYEAKINEYQEKELFAGLNEKQVNLAKTSIPTYKDISKEEALSKIKEEYVEIFSNSNVSSSNNDKEKQKDFNPADLLKLDNAFKNNKKLSLEEKAKTKGLTDKEEILEYTKQMFSTIK